MSTKRGRIILFTLKITNMETTNRVKVISKDYSLGKIHVCVCVY